MIGPRGDGRKAKPLSLSRSVFLPFSSSSSSPAACLLPFARRRFFVSVVAYIVVAAVIVFREALLNPSFFVRGWGSSICLGTPFVCLSFVLLMLFLLSFSLFFVIISLINFFFLFSFLFPPMFSFLPSSEGGGDACVRFLFFCDTWFCILYIFLWSFLSFAFVLLFFLFRHSRSFFSFFGCGLKATQIYAVSY